MSEAHIVEDITLEAKGKRLAAELRFSESTVLQIVEECERLAAANTLLMHENQAVKAQHARLSEGFTKQTKELSDREAELAAIVNPASPWHDGVPTQKGRYIIKVLEAHIPIRIEFFDGENWNGWKSEVVEKWAEVPQ